MLKYLDEYRDAGLVGEISSRIKGLSSKQLNIMEVCGGHTMSIRKHGIHELVGDNINLISGPGCPVCVTSISDMDRAIALSECGNTVLCTFGDMFSVPGSRSSLEKARAGGADVRTVYSVHDALSFAAEEKDKDFIFLSIGFETTAPTAAAAVLQAKKENIDNFFVLSLNKTMPAALKAVLSGEDSRIDALICPGHVSTITGTGIYRPIVNDLGVSCCVSGFEPADVLSAIYFLVESHEEGRPRLVNAYRRAVREEGNRKACAIIDRVFEPCDAEWRGLGMIPDSGLKLRKEYSGLDAGVRFKVDVPPSAEFPGCICGDILRGAKDPSDCPLFGKACIPEGPKGACMVSSEGACAAWYKYGN
ncbi:MAG: hydrogenase formation protein HypD [Candidatus Omnitrophica bacterium]|nr:hydrogenase formation protein HypD [Candidatus Omnitrophota bacterium]